ncbi:hypothetical protein [Maribacter polysaccharolyticus]|uniref:hypothetical protein n=1 Tax=Maribacter polysaccharolyticus TaxID=3020831 RepID=UPI00237FA651|nr:hypothetical protein [Maribacter polysaccharolyticus]MDE3744025.1 hypothetical protein [Maribacter polysaccharolyticus]
MKTIFLSLLLFVGFSVFSQVDEDPWSDFEDDPTDETAPEIEPDVDQDTRDRLYYLAANENTSGYEITPEAVDYLLEHGISPFVMEQYLAGEAPLAINDIIEDHLYDYERQVADQVFEDITDGDDTFDFELLEHLNPEDMEEAQSAMDEFISSVEAPNIDPMKMDATYIKERFLVFIEANKKYILRHAEYIVVFNLILDLVNNDVNIAELMRIAQLPDTSILGNPLERTYDRHITEHLEHFKNAIPGERLEQLSISFENGILENFDPKLSEIILNEY